MVNIVSSLFEVGAPSMARGLLATSSMASEGVANETLVV